MFLSRNKKNRDNFWLKKVPYQDLCLFNSTLFYDVYLLILILKFIINIGLDMTGY